jgi:hypothetical protein
LGEQNVTKYGKRAQKFLQRPEFQEFTKPGGASTERHDRGRPIDEGLLEPVARALFKHKQGATIRSISKDAGVKWETAAMWLEVLHMRGLAKMVMFGNSKVYIPIEE